MKQICPYFFTDSIRSPRINIVSESKTIKKPTSDSINFCIRVKSGYSFVNLMESVGDPIKCDGDIRAEHCPYSNIQSP